MATGLMTRPGAAPALALPCRRDAERVNAARSCSRSPVRAQFGSVSSFNWWRKMGVTSVAIVSGFIHVHQRTGLAERTMNANVIREETA